MNDRFVERLEHPIARGLEKRPQETEDEARRRQENMAQMNGENVVCVCGKAFQPTRSNLVYCSKRCRDARQRQSDRVASAVRSSSAASSSAGENSGCI